MDDRYYNDEEKNAYTHADNAVVNNEGGDSQTPSVLVAESPSETYEEESQHGSKLSPNPANFGFTKQLFVDSLPESPIVNTLYILNVYNNGTLVGYCYYKWNPSDGWVLLQNVNEPNQTPVKGEQIASEDNAIVVNEAREVVDEATQDESEVNSGTQLYLHTFSNSANSTKVYAVMLNSDPITSGGTLLYGTLHFLNVSVSSSSQKRYLPYLSAANPGELSTLYVINIGSGGTLTQETLNYGVWVDTVTEL